MELSADALLSPFVSAVVLELEFPQPGSTETAITADNPNATVLLVFYNTFLLLLVGFIIDPIPLVFVTENKKGKLVFFYACGNIFCKNGTFLRNFQRYFFL